MRIFRDCKSDDSARLALAVGNFDGVHLGHRALIARLKELADARNLAAAAVTFEPHPLEFFKPQTPHPRLTTLREKMLKLRALGISRVYALPFNARLAATSAEEFAEKLLSAGAKLFLVGEDFRFGAGRKGDADFLAKMAANQGAEVLRMPSVADSDGGRISSACARRLLASGDFSAAAKILGEPFCISGRVIRGDGVGGSRLGFPTANLHRRCFSPCAGIFAARAKIGGDKKPIPAAVSIGIRPTVNSSVNSAAQIPIVEAHLLDFSGDLYGKRMSLEFVEKLRDEIRYKNLDDLAAAIAEDVRRIAEILRQ